MNPTVVQELARFRLDTFRREAEAGRPAALAKGATIRPLALHDRLNRTARRLRLVLRGSVA